MSASMYMYDGDGLLHAAPRRRPATVARPVPAAATTPASQPAPAAPSATPAMTIAERKGEALRRFFPKIGAWLADWAYFARMREVEHYLSQATDAVDLEARIRRLERGPAMNNLNGY